MGLGMFCAIPLPFFIWDEKLMSAMTATYPLVGAVVGALWWLISWGLIALNIPLMLAAATMALVPFLLTGFIHLDGYMDTSDAHLSRRDLEERLRILKDPLVGAFAVVMLIVLILFQFASMYTVMQGGRFLVLLAFIPVISRCCGALSIFFLKHLEISNYTKMLQGAKPGEKVFVVMLLLAATAGAYLYGGLAGLLVAAAAIAGSFLAILRMHKSFGGISGDILGFSLVMGELCGVIALAVIQNW